MLAECHMAAPGVELPATVASMPVIKMHSNVARLRRRFENVVARHHRLGEGVRQAVEGWGLKTLCKNPRWKSDSLTVVETPSGVDSNKIVKNAYAKYDLSLGIGLAQINGKVSSGPGVLSCPGMRACLGLSLD